MKLKLNKLITFALAVGTILTVFSGCSKNEETEPDANMPIDKASVQGEEVSSENKTENETEYPVITTDQELKIHGVIATVGNTGFELYTYLDGPAQKYAGVINDVAESLSGVANVYDMIVPTSTGITLPDKYYDSITSSNQKESIEKITGYLSPSVKTVNIYETLMQHRDEYIYFRTDHHWTALGAYYAYREYCAAAGITPTELEDHESVDFTGFLGSFYNDSDNAPELNDPDTVTAYYPISENASLRYTGNDGVEYDWPIISDATNYGSSLKYCTFAAGDQPFTVITNSDKTDGSTCVVVKESFGNALIPFLVDNYQTVYVIDYRYWSGDFTSFVKESGAKDVLFINNISMTRSDYLIGKLAQAVA